MKQKNNNKHVSKQSRLGKYRAKSVRLDNTNGQTTPPEHYGSGAIYVSREDKKD